MNQLSRKYGTYEKQEELLGMIRDIDELLEENGIAYSLCGGSLLGAVRDNGFIPWDDDIDIMVSRDNYNKLVRFFAADNDSAYTLNRHLWVNTIQRREDAGKGPNVTTIDVFVMDNCPDNAHMRRMKTLMIKVMQGMMKEEQIYEGHSLPQKAALWLTHILGVPFSEARKFKWYHKIAMIGDKKKTKHMTGYTDLYKTLSLQYSGELFRSVVKHPFEDIELPITAEYDSYLRTQYGDYMTPPDEKDRVPIHSM